MATVHLHLFNLHGDTQMENQTKLLTADQVADILGVTSHTLAVWRSTGRYSLRYVKSGRLVRYREADVLSFIERRTQTHNACEA